MTDYCKRCEQAEQLLRRALRESARVHPDFMGEIQEWLEAGDDVSFLSEGGVAQMIAPRCRYCDRALPDELKPSEGCPYCGMAADSASAEPANPHEFHVWDGDGECKICKAKLDTSFPFAPL
jgi:hypothetical protein